ncbi:MAG TPA: type II toxin-antitoxin system VapC family toxin [Rhizomicrobium sp.]
MTDYLDTSLLVAAATREPKTIGTQSWLSARPAGALAISDWVIAEFSAALSVKLRTRQLNESERADALAKFAQWTAEAFDTLPVKKSSFQSAAKFADQYKLGLRAGDALHMAIAFEAGARLCTLDSDLYHAASALSVNAMLL